MIKDTDALCSERRRGSKQLAQSPSNSLRQRGVRVCDVARSAAGLCPRYSAPTSTFKQKILIIDSL